MKTIFLTFFFLINFNTFSEVNKVRQFASQSNTITEYDFKAFWIDLGLALRVNDTIALDKYLDTTVYFYGREDKDPKFEFKNRDRINKVRQIYLIGGYYDFRLDSNISYKAFFLNQNAYKCDYVENNDYQNIKDFVFRRYENNVWKLTTVYSDTKYKK